MIIKSVVLVYVINFKMYKLIFIVVLISQTTCGIDNDTLNQDIMIEDWCKICTRHGNQTFFKYVLYTWKKPKYFCNPYPQLDIKYGVIVDFR